MSVEEIQEIQNEIKNLFVSESSFECLKIGEQLGLKLSKHSISLNLQSTLQQLVEATVNKKSGLEREGGLLGLAGIIKGMQQSVLPYFLPLISTLLEAESDKGVPVREAAHLCMTNILNTVEKDSISIIMPFLLEGTKLKWQSKIATLKYLELLIDKYPQEICELMPMLIPAITNCLHDTKTQVSDEGIICLISRSIPMEFMV